MTLSASAGGSKPASVHSKAAVSSTREGPRSPAGCQREHGSGSSWPSITKT